MADAAGPRGVVSVSHWSQGRDELRSTQVGGGAGAGKAKFSDTLVQSRSGLGTLAMFDSVTRGSHLTSRTLDGCETATCTSSTLMGDVLITELDLGSPTMLDRVGFNYATIKRDRTDPSDKSVPSKSFCFDILTNVSGRPRGVQPSQSGRRG